jgi:hypothetical protein
VGAIDSTGWVGKQATDRSTDPLTRHRRTAPCPPLVLSFDESERRTPAFAIYRKAKGIE